MKRGGGITDMFTNALDSFKNVVANPQQLKTSNKTEKQGFFSSMSESFNPKKLGGLESTMAEGRKQIQILEEKKQELNSKIEAEIKICNDAQNVLKKEIEAAVTERDQIQEMMARGESQSSSTPESAQYEPYTQNANVENANVETNAEPYVEPNVETNAEPYVENANVENANVEPNTEVTPEDEADDNVRNQAEALSSTDSSLTAGEIGGSEGLFPGLNKQGGTRRKKKKTKRRRRRGYSRKKKESRGRGRSRRRRGF